MRTFRMIAGWTLWVAAIMDIGVGWHAINVHNSMVTSYWGRWTFYDGPWIPVEFGLLIVGRLIIPEREATK